MKKLITYTVTALFATIAWSMAGPDKDAMEAKEKAAWQSFKDKKADEFKKVVDKDIRCVYADGVSNLEKELADMKKWPTMLVNAAPPTPPGFHVWSSTSCARRFISAERKSHSLSCPGVPGTRGP